MLPMFVPATGPDRAQAARQENPTGPAGSWRFGRYSATMPPGGMARMLACHRARWRHQRPPQAGSACFRREHIVSDSQWRQLPAIARSFRLSKLTACFGKGNRRLANTNNVRCGMRAASPFEGLLGLLLVCKSMQFLGRMDKAAGATKLIEGYGFRE